MARLMRSAWAASIGALFCAGAPAVGEPEGFEAPPEDVSTEHRGSRLSPPMRQTRAVAFRSGSRRVMAPPSLSAWRSEWLVDPGANGVFPRLQRGADLLLR